MALNQTVIRGAKPDVRATAFEISLLRDSDGQGVRATLPTVGIREALAKGAADGRISKTTKRGLMLDTFHLQLLHVSEDVVTLTFSMRSRGGGEGHAIQPPDVEARGEERRRQRAYIALGSAIGGGGRFYGG